MAKKKCKCKEKKDPKEMTKLKQFETGLEVEFEWKGGEIINKETGDKYVHEQHAYWNKEEEIKKDPKEIWTNIHDINTFQVADNELYLGGINEFGQPKTAVFNAREIL